MYNTGTISGFLIYFASINKIEWFFPLSQIKDPYISQLESQEKLDEDDQEKEEEDGKNLGPINVCNHRARGI